MDEALRNIKSGLVKRQAALEKSIQFHKKWKKKKEQITNELNKARKNIIKIMDQLDESQY